MSSREIKEKMNELIIEEVEKCINNGDPTAEPILEAPHEMEASKSGANTGNVLSLNGPTPASSKVASAAHTKKNSANKSLDGEIDLERQIDNQEPDC